MKTDIKDKFFQYISDKYGNLKKIGNSLSMFAVNNDQFRIYIRYSKLHNDKTCFYGFRKSDLLNLQGRISFICLLWSDQQNPLIIPYSDIEQIFKETEPANDGQYKVQIILKEFSTEFYLAKTGRFNVDSYYGYEEIDRQVTSTDILNNLELSHSQVQSILGYIGFMKGYQIWIPPYDRDKIDKSFLPEEFKTNFNLPEETKSSCNYMKEIDVIWIEKGSNKFKALYEVEHSTPIYSGLLRFNDVLLTSVQVDSYSIVSNEKRKSLFIKQLYRPTFKKSGLSDICTFFDYSNVYYWYKNLIENKT